MHPGLWKRCRLGACKRTRCVGAFVLMGTTESPKRTRFQKEGLGCCCGGGGGASRQAAAARAACQWDCRMRGRRMPAHCPRHSKGWACAAKDPRQALFFFLGKGLSWRS
jgi:hypothetical protein